MEAQLEQVGSCLDEASRSLTAGQMEQTCAHLAQAVSILDTLIAAVIPTAVDEPQQPTTIRAMAMVA
jgi:hypothetical protein